jgi:diadenosine tetraphosphate (Ap4A) HIT family hydrolase
MPHCPFCTTNRERIAENNLAFAIYDGFPVNLGHALIIPKRHVANFFELSAEERMACFDLVSEVQLTLASAYRPDGYNVGININEAGGQTIFHVHIHLIPRYRGDVEQPRGGVRGVIPNKQGY